MPRRHFKKGERSMQRLYRFSFSFMMVSLDCEGIFCARELLRTLCVVGVILS